jgi:thiamine biosynthesis lipoprotein ApbE
LIWADVLATAAFVHGPGAIEWLDEFPDYQGLTVDNSGTTSSTPGFWTD